MQVLEEQTFCLLSLALISHHELWASLKGEFGMFAMTVVVQHEMLNLVKTVQGLGLCFLWSMIV